MDYLFDYLNLLHRRQVVVPKADTPQSAKAAAPMSGRKRTVLNPDDDVMVDEAGLAPGSAEAYGDFPQASDSAVKKRKKNRHGLVTLNKGVVSMWEQVLSEAVPSKDRDDGALSLLKPSR